MSLWAYIIPGIFAVIVALIELRAAYDRKQEQKLTERSERRAARRAEESRLSMELMSANCKLALVTAKKVTDQHVNGDLADAMNSAKEAQNSYDEYIRREAANQTVKT